MESSIKEKYLIWTAVGLAICVISLGVTIIIGSDFGHDNFIRLIVFVCSNVFGWLVYLVFQSFIFDAYHIYKLKFGKKHCYKDGLCCRWQQPFRLLPYRRLKKKKKRWR